MSWNIAFYWWSFQETWVVVPTLPWNCHDSGHLPWVLQHSLGGKRRLWTRWSLRLFLDLKLWFSWKGRVPILKSLEMQVVISLAFPKKHWLRHRNRDTRGYDLYIVQDFSIVRGRNPTQIGWSKQGCLLASTSWNSKGRASPGKLGLKAHGM